MDTDMLRLTRRQRWILVAGAASAVAAPLAERAIAGAWRLVSGEDPPDDPVAPNVDWGRTIMWTAGLAAIAAVAQLGARHGAALAWKGVTGDPPPRSKHATRRRRRR
jgi:hypothetical protein